MESVPTTLGDACRCFLEKSRLSPRTREAYELGLRVFQRFIQKTGYKGSLEKPPAESEQFPLHGFDEEVLLRFFQWLQDEADPDDPQDKRPYSSSTINVYLSAVKRLFRLMYALDALGPGFNLSRATDKLKVGVQGLGRPRRRVIMPDARIPQIVLYYDNLELPEDDGKPSTRRKRLRILRDRAIVHTIYDTAGRVSEIASLTREQVQDGGISEVVITGKGDQERVIFFTAETQRAIQAYCRERGHDGYPALFISHGRDEGTPLTRVSLWRVIKKAVRALGLTGSISPHDFRHYRATQLLNQGARLEDVQAILGHANITTTRQIYAHTSRRTLRDVFHTFTPSPEEALADYEEELQRGG